MPFPRLAPLFVLFACGSPNLEGADWDLEVHFTVVPSDGTDDAAAWFSFEATDADTYRCQVEGEAAVDCDGDHLAVPMKPGSHSLSVTAIAPDGSEGAPTSHNWTTVSVFDAPNEELVPTTQQPEAAEPNSWRGIFRINCDFSHGLYDDPIVLPGLPGGAHLHRFYGNLSVDAFTGLDDLYLSPESSCQGNTVNSSSYWVPALLAPSYDQMTGARLLDDLGAPAWEVVPAVVGNDDVAHEVFYYSAAIDDLDAIQNVPPGLRIVAGSSATLPSDPPQDTGIVRWHCQEWESDDASNPVFSATIPECFEPDRVRMDIFFPSCWNGVDLDSANHQSHMAYPVDDGSELRCPDTHPVPLLRPSYHYAWPVLPGNSDPDTQSSKGWRLASDHYEVTDTQPGGLSLHGDWFNAWHPEVLGAALENCVQAGLDCHDGNLANGYRLSGTTAGTQTTPDVVNEGLGTH